VNSAIVGRMLQVEFIKELGVKNCGEKHLVRGVDKYLLGIIVGIVLLVAATVIIVFTRPKAEYLTDESPEAIVHNYLLAIKEADYDRAYGYISSEIDVYPEDLEIFIEVVEDESWSFGEMGDSVVQVLSSRVRGDKTIVKVLETSYSSGGLFDSSQYDRNFEMKLHQEKGRWKLVDGDLYWYSCWGEQNRSWCD